jgi:ABC-type phosphate/phosphonate transport system substrate-binding protein
MMRVGSTISGCSGVRPYPHLVLLLIVMVAGCDGENSSEYKPTFGDAPASDTAVPEYRFAIFPLHSSVRLFEVYQPLATAINRQAAGFTVKTETSRDFASIESRIRQRQVHLALLNPYQAIEAETLGYRTSNSLLGWPRWQRGL